ncbi:MAG: metal-transporting ATPase, partial [Eubacteriales bacterium]
AIMVGNGMGARNGILFKTAVSLEETGKIQIVALDKTGTITEGDPRVTDIIPVNGVSEQELLETAASLERKSEHPLAKAILMKSEQSSAKTGEVSDFHAVPGNGLTGVSDGKRLIGGSVKFIGSQIPVSDTVLEKAEELAENGRTPLLFASEDRLIGLIAVADVIKEDSPRAVKELQGMGIHVVMLTGDNEKTAKAIGAQSGVDEVVAGVLPDGKERVIRDLQKYGKVAMVGDGINDAPALTRADIGIAIGAGADIAIDAADLVLMKSRLSDVPAAVRLSRATLRNIHENLFWAFIYNIIGIPLAIGVFIPLGLTLNPMFGAAAMSLSSVCVVANALRLNLFNMRSAKRDRKLKPVVPKKANEASTREKTKTEKTLHIEGMLCGHCENRVQSALEALSQVESAAVSHENGTAVVTLKAGVSDDVLKNAAEKQGYKVTSIE